MDEADKWSAAVSGISLTYMYHESCEWTDTTRYVSAIYDHNIVHVFDYIILHSLLHFTLHTCHFNKCKCMQIVLFILIFTYHMLIAHM